MSWLLRSVVVLLLACCADARAACVQGSVYDDANRDRRREPTEIGIANVLVSDGDTVVATDSDGSYRLPGAERATLLVKPAGYDAPERTGHLPDVWKPATASDCDFALRRRSIFSMSMSICIPSMTSP